MKAVVLYRPNSEHARKVEEYVRDFEHQKGKIIKLIDLNTRDGVALATLYDIWRFPCIMVLKDDGQVIKDWQDDLLPTTAEVDGYLVGQETFAKV